MLRLLYAPLLSALLAIAATSAFAASGDDGLDLKLNIDGDEVHLDISYVIDAKPREVWAVLTDFDRMADFISNLTSSQIIARNSGIITVEQKGKAGTGPISFSMDSVREIQMKPYEWIRSHLVSGSMKKFDGITRISEEGSKTRIVYHSDAVSATWIPPIVGRTLIESEAREQFTQLMQEVQRRKQQALAANSR